MEEEDYFDDVDRKIQLFCDELKVETLDIIFNFMMEIDPELIEKLRCVQTCIYRFGIYYLVSRNISNEDIEATSHQR